MSYLKSMEKAKMMTETVGAKKDFETIGGIDLLIGSAPAGNASEPWFLMLKKSQLKTIEAKAVIGWIKGNKVPGADSMWSHTFDSRDKWHQIDNRGTVRLRLHCPACPAP
jgi:hypothetical protein